MEEYKAEGLCRSALTMTAAELEEAFFTNQILQATALAFDRTHRLRFSLAGKPAYMEYNECADGVESGQVRDIAILTRVGKPTCFVIKQLPQANHNFYLLSRREAQVQCRREYLDHLCAGDLLHCCVTHIESFGAFCDVGCGISALLPIDCLSVSRIQSPADRVHSGENLICVLKSRDAQGRFVLSLRELLGTWQENANQFNIGETVVGIVRSIEEYGVFIELTPNLAGLAEYTDGVCVGQPVSVFIKNILPDKMKIKLVIVNHELTEPLRFPLQYTKTSGHLAHWVYSTSQSTKQIESFFDALPPSCTKNDLLL